MNVDNIFHWIRLVALAILEVFGGDGPGKSFGLPSGMKPERIQIWLRIIARAALAALDEVGWPDAGGRAPQMKPERIQFWVRLIARFVLELAAGANEETGKSGETHPEDGGW